MKAIRYTKLVFIIMLGLTFCFSGHATKWVISVANYQFTPSTIPNVNPGDTIRWEWVSGSHTTTSTTIPAGATTWDMPINSSSTSYEYEPAVSGTYNYKCTIHASMGMTGSFTVSGVVPTLVVTPSNQNVTSAAGSTSFTVTSNSDWTASTPAAWCSVTPSGTGNGIIGVNYDANTSVNQRIATITVTVSGIPSQTVTVTQAGAPQTLAVTPSNQNVAKSAGTTNFSVVSNTNWVAASNAPWCTVTPSGTGNGTLNVNYTDNSSGPPRVATITVTVTGLTPQTVTVSQDGTTGIADKSKNEISIFPNPTSGIVNIVPGEPGDQVIDLTIMNITGSIIQRETVNSGQPFSLDLSANPNGNYFLMIKSGNGIKTRKIILEK